MDIVSRRPLYEWAAPPPPGYLHLWGQAISFPLAHDARLHTHRERLHWIIGTVIRRKNCVVYALLNTLATLSFRWVCSTDLSLPDPNPTRIALVTPHRTVWLAVGSLSTPTFLTFAFPPIPRFAGLLITMLSKWQIWHVSQTSRAFNHMSSTVARSSSSGADPNRDPPRGPLGPLSAPSAPDTFKTYPSTAPSSASSIHKQVWSTSPWEPSPPPYLLHKHNCNNNSTCTKTHTCTTATTPRRQTLAVQPPELAHPHHRTQF